MIKLIVAVKKRGDMSVEEFHRYWREVHARKVNACPATQKYVRKYVQCHTVPSEYQQGEPSFSGTAELWFESVEDKASFFNDPDYLRDVQPDEEAFADMEKTVFFVTREEVVTG